MVEVGGPSNLETIVRIHNARLVMAIADRVRAATTTTSLSPGREPPMLGVYLIALADAMRGDSAGAMRIAGALGKQRRGVGYGVDALRLELELARRAIAELMTDLEAPALDRLRDVTHACTLEAAAHFRATESARG